MNHYPTINYLLLDPNSYELLDLSEKEENVILSQLLNQFEL